MIWERLDIFTTERRRCTRLMVKLATAKPNSACKASVGRTQIDLSYSLSTLMHRRKLLKVEDQHPPSYSLSATMLGRKLLSGRSASTIQSNALGMQLKLALRLLSKQLVVPNIWDCFLLSDAFLELDIVYLVIRVKAVFRKMIQNRISLLNSRSL